MVIKIKKPSVHLSKDIKYFWILENGSTEHTEIVYPSGEMQILFHCKKPFIENQPDGKEYNQPAISVCGQKTTFNNVKSPSFSNTIGVVFYPYSASRFLPFSVDEINDSVVHISDVFGDWTEYEETFYYSANDTQRIKIIEDFLSKKTITPKTQYELVKNFADKINNFHGSLPLHKLYREYNVSEKTIQRLFKQYIGITPKQFSEFIRTGYAIDLLKNGKYSPDVWLNAGYYDQAHFIKKMKTYTGRLPGELAAICKQTNVGFIQ